MIVYPGKLEPILDTRITPPSPSFVVRFRDIPEVAHIGDAEEDAIELAAQALMEALFGRKLKGQAMPSSSPMEPGEIGYPAPLYWML